MYNPDMKEYEKEYCIYAEERAGKSGIRFFRRGFPFAKGILKDECQAILTDFFKKLRKLKNNK